MALLMPWFEAPCEPTPLELAAWLGVSLEGGVAFCWVLDSDEATGAVVLLPIAPDDGAVCCAALWLVLMAPVVPPVV